VTGSSASASQPGVEATNTGSGPGPVVVGPSVFSRSGVATVAGSSTAKKSSVVVKAVALSSSSIVLATLQTHPAGVGVAAVVPDVSKSEFTIFLSKDVTESVDVGWFVVN
jgi:hypothetical protein